LGAALVALVGAARAQPRTEEPLFKPAPGSPIAVAGYPGNIALGDVNQDGKPDLVVASGPGFTVLLGQGDGGFSLAPGSPVQVPARPNEMVLRDLNGDGRMDLALADHNSYAVTLLWGDGHGGFAPADEPPVIMKAGERPHTHGLDAGDLNGDGHLDLVTVNSEDSDVSVAFGDGRGGFTPAASSFAVGAQPYPATLADLNGDGHLDIIATSTSRRTPEAEASTRALTLLLGDGQGRFRNGRIPLRTVLPWFMAVADMNGDGSPDLAATHAERNELTILLGDGRGGFTETPASPIDLGRSAWRMAVTDVNGDGKADVVAAAGDGLIVLLGGGQGDFQPAPGSPFACGKGTWQLAVGDLNADGRADVAVTNLEADTVTVLLAR